MEIENNERTKSMVWVTASILIIFGVISMILNKFDSSMSVFGSIASIIGLVVAISEIMKTKNIAEVTKEKTLEMQESVKTNIDQMGKILSLSDISKLCQIPNEIQTFIQNRRYDMAYDKMRLLKDNLVEILNNPYISKENSIAAEITKSIQELSVRIRSFSNALPKSTVPYASKATIELMENIRTQLVTLSSNIKYGQQ